ncbi:GMC oxidoreductase [Sphaerobolus stellatus SS14]|uniref:Pyranose 2-oxidase n=1 Tax=Sphaerobolus stellatus (strain SS14) TaxID=990650 RepID=A0A0C9W4C2_SPHS4|nr:GMC oxidoreductase [Sphaerobolus stellatus SS14]
MSKTARRSLDQPEGLRNYPNHPIHQESGIPEFDVFIAGSGPIGATFARLLVKQGYKVVMAEVGDQDTRVPAAHKKNEIEYQKDIDRFGALSKVSVPPSSTIQPTLDPSSWKPSDPSKMSILNARNPRQSPHNNLDDEQVTRGVGGMSTHWTCAVPHFLKGLERPVILPFSEADDDAEWQTLYNAAAVLIGRNTDQFDESIRHNLVLDTLQKAYRDRDVQPLPLACHRVAPGSPYVMWHSAENVFGDIFTNAAETNGYFKLLTNLLCSRLAYEGTDPVKIVGAEVRDLLEEKLGDEQKKYYIKAKIYVIAAGAVCTPQLLANSGFGAGRNQANPIIPALSTHITEQPMAFCQVVLKQVDSAGDLSGKPAWWQAAVNRHREKNPLDPMPIPFYDPDPQVTIPATLERPWHTQIHRDAFSYGDVGPRVDGRLVVDLRWFCMQDGVPENRILFESDIHDAYSMPQPTFEYTPTTTWAEEAHKMMKDMTDVADKLGGYLPGSSPQFMLPGLALHLGGTVRLGREFATSVANFNSQAWKFNNLYVGGNGVIPEPFGANPTLTSIALAIRAAFDIHTQLRKSGGPTPPNPLAILTRTPESWVEWANPKNRNYPDHYNLRKLHKSV